jgi:hypothetical protein
VESDPKDRKMKRKTWPSKKPLPRFASDAEEVAFWEAHDVPWDDEAEGEEVSGPTVVAAAKQRNTVKVTLSAPQAAVLDRLAKRQHLSREQALQAIIGQALRAGRAPRRKGSARGVSRV